MKARQRKRRADGPLADAASLLITGARLLDPATGLDATGYLGIRNGRIDHVGRNAPRQPYAKRLDARRLWLLPGAVDLCARLREPGQTHKATIRSEAYAAAAGGVTTLCVPPDTQPVVDTPAVVDRIRNRARDVGGVEVHVLGALTRGLAGDTLAEMSALKAAGCVGVSNALAPMAGALMARRALEYARTHDLAVHVVPLDAPLANGGCAHEGAVATRLGLPGIPAAAESVAIAQWLALVEETGARVHFGRLSSARGVALVEAALERRLPVTADVAAHQLFLTEEDVGEYDTACRVIPPLRSKDDREALRRAVKRGTIAAICSDHQPHELDAKTNPFPIAEPGVSGLETLVPLVLDLVAEKLLRPLEAVARITSHPAAILGLDVGRLAQGAPADLVLVDPAQRWTLDASKLLSAGRCTPFEGREFRGQVVHTLRAGRTVFAR